MEQKKRAELTSTFLVKTLIVILAFIIIIFFIIQFQDFWKGSSKKEICHDSIILRAGLNKKASLSASEIIPLNCETEKLCIKGKDDCSDEFGKSRDDNLITEKRVINRDEIIDILADSLYDCHSMLGEGNLNFMPHKSYKQIYGVICTKIVFSEEAKEILTESGGDVSYLELYTRMNKKSTRNNDETYLEALYQISGTTRLNSFLSAKFLEWKSTIIDSGRASEYSSFNSMTVSDWKIDSDIPWAIVAQIAPQGTWKSWAYAGTAGGAIAVVGIIFAIPTGGTSLALASLGIVGGLAGGTVVGGLTLLQTSPDGEFEYISPTFYPYDVRVLRNLGIYEFVFAP